MPRDEGSAEPERIATAMLTLLASGADWFSDPIGFVRFESP